MNQDDAYHDVSLGLVLMGFLGSNRLQINVQSHGNATRRRGVPIGGMLDHEVVRVRQLFRSSAKTNN